MKVSDVYNCILVSFNLENSVTRLQRHSIFFPAREEFEILIPEEEITISDRSLSGCNFSPLISTSHRLFTVVNVL